MTDAAKLIRLKILLGDEDGLPSDDVLSEYLSMAGDEILNWLYIRTSVPSGVSVPTAYDQVQIMSVIAGINIIGAENPILYKINM